jgi:hypothetical protein
MPTLRRRIPILIVATFLSRLPRYSRVVKSRDRLAQRRYVLLGLGINVAGAFGARIAADSIIQLGIWILAAICVAQAAYSVWAREYEARTSAEAELTADKEKSRREHTRAIEQQTHEMRRQREQHERELDPALRAFREQRFQAMNSGGEIDEESIDILIWWIAARSAWGRWQAAQHHYYQPNAESAEPPQMLLQLTASNVLGLLCSGKIIARARREADESYVELSPDFWTTKFFRIQPDLFRIYKAEIVWRPDGTDTRPIGYRYPRCEWKQLKAIFPEHDEKIDAVTARLLADKESSS